MSSIIAKRMFKVPPCKVDKDLVKKTGRILEEESPKIYQEIFDVIEEKVREGDFYKKYPEKLESLVKERVYSWEYKPMYSLIADSKNIESSDIGSFVTVEWPADTRQISLSIGKRKSPKTINIELYLKHWRMGDSEVNVTGNDSTWVNGIADRLEAIFQKKKLGYHVIAKSFYMRILLSILTWTSIAFAVFYPLWPLIRQILREGTKWESFFLLVFVLGAGITTYPLSELLSWLFPRFEFGESSLARRVRKWIWGLLVSSGLIGAVIFKLLGLG